MSSNDETPSAVAPPEPWWMQPLPVICLMVVALTFIQQFDWGLFSRKDQSAGTFIASGTLYSVRYDLGGGKVGGMTRSRALRHDGAVAETSVDMRATLTRDALLVHRLLRYEGGNKPVYETEHPHVIPFDRIYEVQFGDRGIVLPQQHPANDPSDSHTH